jgi:hypothetical protein
MAKSILCCPLTVERISSSGASDTIGKTAAIAGSSTRKSGTPFRMLSAEGRACSGLLLSVPEKENGIEREFSGTF